MDKTNIQLSSCNGHTLYFFIQLQYSLTFTHLKQTYSPSKLLMNLSSHLLVYSPTNSSVSFCLSTTHSLPQPIQIPTPRLVLSPTLFLTQAPSHPTNCSSTNSTTHSSTNLPVCSPTHPSTLLLSQAMTHQLVLSHTNAMTHSPPATSFNHTSTPLLT